MNKNKECNIIQDILPNYIDKLTSNETNKYIEEHIKECETCRNILKNMQSGDTIDKENNKKEYIDFAKKYNRKFNILKLILVVCLIIVVGLITRKAIIITTLFNKAEDYKNMSNYYTTYYQYDSNNIEILESFNKDGKYLKTLKTIEKRTGKIVSKLTETYNGEKTNLYIDSQNEKKVILDTKPNVIMPFEAKNYYLYFDSNWDFIKSCIFSNVKNVECNGVDCYRFTDLYNSQLANFKYENYVYIDKNTGLAIRSLGGIISDNSTSYNVIIDFYYGFNTVIDEDLVEPNIEEYIIQD